MKSDRRGAMTLLAVGALALAALIASQPFAGAQPAGGLSAVLGPGIVSVMDHGAKGDGAGDDTKAIQAALDAVSKAGGLVVIPRGTYKTTGTVFLNGSNVQVKGVGISSRIQYMGSGGAMIAASPTSHTAGTYYTSCKIEDLFLFSETADVGLDFTGFSYSTFRDLGITLKGSNRKLIMGKGQSGHAPYYNVFDSLTLSGNNDGTAITGSAGFSFEQGDNREGANGPNANMFTNIKRVAALDYGFDLRAGNGNLGVNISLESIRQAAFRLNFNPPKDTGRATAADNNTLTDTSKNWKRNYWVNSAIVIKSGPGAGEIRKVANNTEKQLRVRQPWSQRPGPGSTYEIFQMKATREKFLNIRQEGGGPAPVDFIRAYPGTYDNHFSQYMVESLRGGKVANDAERDPSNRWAEKDPGE